MGDLVKPLFPGGNPAGPTESCSISEPKLDEETRGNQWTEGFDDLKEWW